MIYDRPVLPPSQFGRQVDENPCPPTWGGGHLYVPEVESVPFTMSVAER